MMPLPSISSMAARRSYSGLATFIWAAEIIASATVVVP